MIFGLSKFLSLSALTYFFWRHLDVQKSDSLPEKNNLINVPRKCLKKVSSLILSSLGYLKGARVSVKVFNYAVTSSIYVNCWSLKVGWYVWNTNSYVQTFRKSLQMWFMHFSEVELLREIKDIKWAIVM